MKVMHFIHGLNTGGAETLVKNYMLNFDKENFDVVLLSMDRKKSPYENELAKSGIKIIYVQDFLPLKGCVKILNKFYQYLIVKRIIRKGRNDKN